MALVTLDEARSFLNIRDTGAAIDTEIQAAIDAVTVLVEREVGPIVQRSVTSVVSSRNGRAVLPLKNIISITSITNVIDGSVVSVTGLSTTHSILGYTSGTHLPNGDLSVVYVVGVTPVPKNIKYGALEVLKLAWAAQSREELPAFLLSYRASAWFLPDQVLPGFA